MLQNMDGRFNRAAPRRATVQDVQAVQNVRGTADSIAALVWSFKNPIFF
jgi:hypothetical protein